MRFLLRARPRHDVAGLVRRPSHLAEPILPGLGFGTGRVATIETDDPEALGAALRAIPAMPSRTAPGELPALLAPSAACCVSRCASCIAPHRSRSMWCRSRRARPSDRVDVDVAGCTLCLACVSACPTGALTDDPERPMLRFAEDACVQCGLCQATCPEKVITLKPQLDFRAATAAARVLKEEQPFCCIRCGKPFGVKSTIERVAAKLEGKHWMYKGTPEPPRRHQDVRRLPRRRGFRAGLRPYGAPPRAPVRTTEDYLREREAQEQKEKVKDES